VDGAFSETRLAASSAAFADRKKSIETVRTTISPLRRERRAGKKTSWSPSGSSGGPLKWPTECMVGDGGGKGGHAKDTSNSPGGGYYAGVQRG